MPPYGGYPSNQPQSPTGALLDTSSTAAAGAGTGSCWSWGGGCAAADGCAPHSPDEWREYSGAGGGGDSYESDGRWKSFEHGRRSGVPGGTGRTTTAGTTHSGSGGVRTTSGVSSQARVNKEGRKTEVQVRDGHGCSYHRDSSCSSTPSSSSDPYCAQMNEEEGEEYRDWGGDRGVNLIPGGQVGDSTTAALTTTTATTSECGALQSASRLENRWQGLSGARRRRHRHHQHGSDGDVYCGDDGGEEGEEGTQTLVLNPALMTSLAEDGTLYEPIIQQPQEPQHGSSPPAGSSLPPLMMAMSSHHPHLTLTPTGGGGYCVGGPNGGTLTPTGTTQTLGSEQGFYIAGRGGSPRLLGQNNNQTGGGPFEGVKREEYYSGFQFGSFPHSAAATGVGGVMNGLRTTSSAASCSPQLQQPHHHHLQPHRQVVVGEKDTAVPAIRFGATLGAMGTSLRSTIATEAAAHAESPVWRDPPVKSAGGRAAATASRMMEGEGGYYDRRLLPDSPPVPYYFHHQ
eukprot:GHVU01081522.1.p1 GENE.GHVU01081522.1~~GHVU01081522.1.p1  ORF type:complete len:513 (+),score=66.86 GHVU01081522.1:1161-2699(+)